MPALCNRSGSIKNSICPSVQAVGPCNFLLRQHAGVLPVGFCQSLWGATNPCGVLPIPVGCYQSLSIFLKGITDLPMIPILDQLYTAPQGFITTPASPLVSCTPPLPSPRTAAAGQPPTSSSAFLSKTPSYVHQQSGQVASQTASPSVRVQKLSNSPMTYAEKAAAPAASAAAGSQPPAPNRSNQCLHGIRSTDQVPDALSASFLDADDKPLCSTAGKNALSAALGGSCCFSCCCSRLDSCQQQPSRLQVFSCKRLTP